MDIKKKIKSAVDHVKAHRTLYSAAAGAAVAVAVVKYLDSKKTHIDVDDALSRMPSAAGDGLLYEITDSVGLVLNRVDLTPPTS